MFDIGWQELFIVAVLALIVVGPKDLPRTLRTVTHYVRKARGLAREFRSGLDEVIRESELDDIKQEVRKTANLDLEKEVRDTVDPSGNLTAEFDPDDFADRLKDTVESGPPTGPMAGPAAASGESSENSAMDTASDADSAPAEPSEPIRKAGG